MQQPTLARAAPHRQFFAEFTLIFVLLPLGLALLKPKGMIYAVLWMLSWLTWWILHKHYAYSIRHDWNGSALTKQNIKKIVLRFLPFAVALLIFTWVMIPERMFSLPREKPAIWLMVMMLYPLLSVIPQEFIFRSYFFARYSSWFTKPWHLIATNAFVFGLMHIVLLNWVAVVFSAIGGVLFADTYRKTKSLALVCLEHALYGCFLFTIGLGYYFYHGHAVR